jgi:hypothetical protein
MHTDSLEMLVAEDKPTNLFAWSWQAMLASFTRTEIADPELWGGVLEYAGWVETLPVTRGESNGR